MTDTCLTGFSSRVRHTVDVDSAQLAAEASASLPRAADGQGGGARSSPTTDATPIHPTKAQAGASSSRVLRRGRAGKQPAPTVLLVEDDEKFSGVLARALRRVGLDIETTNTGDGALRAMRSTPPVSAVVLDVMIPHPDGIEVCRQLRRDGWSGPIVAISARTSSTDRARAAAAGANAFLPKPFRLADLCRTVTALLGDDQSSTV